MTILKNQGIGVFLDFTEVLLGWQQVFRMPLFHLLLHPAGPLVTYQRPVQNRPEVVHSVRQHLLRRPLRPPPAHTQTAEHFQEFQRWLLTLQVLVAGPLLVNIHSNLLQDLEHRLIHGIHLLLSILRAQCLHIPIPHSLMAIINLVVNLIRDLR